MAPDVQTLEKLVGHALALILQISAAFVQIGQGDVEQALRSLNAAVEHSARPSYAENPYALDAIYWRARLGEIQEDPAARVSAFQDYSALIDKLPAGARRAEAMARLAALGEPGRIYSARQARQASRTNLTLLGQALHAYAADHGGRLPRGMYDLFDEYVTDPAVFVRPGPRGEGGAQLYVYVPGHRADGLMPANRTEESWELPVVAMEPVAREGRRLVLRLDGSVDERTENR